MLNQVVSPAASDVHVIRQEADPGKTIRVGAYCRVSTNLEVQQSSLELQKASYQRIVQDHPDWVLADIYTDKGLSGTSVNHRPEFIRMIQDAKAGKLDYILVKSISRFSRNTVDLLRCVRELNEIGVHVYFEKERLDTAASSEFLLTLFGAHAQEEIISLSENMKVSRRMRFARGEQQWTHLYGYARGWKIVPEEAEVIRRVLRLYLSGTSLTAITRSLNEEGVPTPTKVGRWAEHTVSMIMRNEKYAGHLLMQKTFIEDPIRHKKVFNRNAIVPQYFKRNHHAPIITDEEWEAARAVMTMKHHTRGVTQYPFYGLLRCPFCGAPMVRFHYLKQDYFWTCGGDGQALLRSERSGCAPYAVYERSLTEAIRSAGLPLDYWPLSRLAESITFPSDSWDTLLVRLKGEINPLRIPIRYDHPGNHPLPVITDSSFPRRVICVNGEALAPSRAGLIVSRISNIQRKALSLPIYPPESSEVSIPRVNPRVKKPQAAVAGLS